MDLRCNKTNCKHNYLTSCEAGKINILKNTECGTYEKCDCKNKENLQDISKTMFESAPEVAGYNHNQNLKVACEAHCIFNNCGKCKANGITVLNEKSDGICGTFIKE